MVDRLAGFFLVRACRRNGRLSQSWPWCSATGAAITWPPVMAGGATIIAMANSIAKKWRKLTGQGYGHTDENYQRQRGRPDLPKWREWRYYGA